MKVFCTVFCINMVVLSLHLVQCDIDDVDAKVDVIQTVVDANSIKLDALGVVADEIKSSADDAKAAAEMNSAKLDAASMEIANLAAAVDNIPNKEEADILIANVQAIVGGTVCPSGWKYYRHRCFHLIHCTAGNPCNFKTMRTNCANMLSTSKLARLFSKEDSDFISAMGGDDTIQIIGLGGTDEAEDKMWIWPDGLRVTYSDWRSPQNSNFNGQSPFGNGDCMFMYRPYSNKWVKASCSDDFPASRTAFACEKVLGELD